MTPTLTETTVASVAERFAAHVAQHEMTVLRDDGLYRHLRFVRVAVNEKTGKPERSSSYWFDLVTWPGCLAVNGDCGSYMFARVDDMFEFFRGGRINPQNWAEKVRGEARLKKYSPERFRQMVTEDISSGDEQFPGPAQEWPGLAEAVEREIFGPDSQWNTEHEEGAREALRDFGFGDTYYASCTCGVRSGEGLSFGEAEAWRVEHRKGPRLGHATVTTGVEGFRFNAWEWDLGDWDWQFLWCCRAIQWGISRYDSKAVPA